MLRIGQLRHRIAVQSRSTSQDTNFGTQVDSWTTVKTIWAYIEPLSDRKIFSAQEWSSEVTHQVTVRYDSTLWADTRAAAALRFTYNGRIFNIHGAMNTDERDRVVLLGASEGLNDG